MMSAKPFVFTALVVVIGCAPPPQKITPAVAPFPVAEYAALDSLGDYTIDGQAFARQAGGDVVFAAGEVVTLDPWTSYTEGWMNRSGRFWARRDILPTDSRFFEYRRSTVTDSEGRFRFNNLPPGRYLLRTGVTWVTGRSSDGLQGGLMWDVVTVPNQTRDLTVVLTPLTTTAVFDD